MAFLILKQNMYKVRAKKYLGQHFLTDKNIAQRIVNQLSDNAPTTVLEIGAGMGMLTSFLLNNSKLDVYTVEIDKESVEYLQNNFPQLQNKIIQADFLKLNLAEYFSQPFAIIGNFPYNISSQILFKMLDNKHLIPELVGMFQKEVAQRIAAPHGSKTYGILSVLLQAYYNVEYLFTVHEHVFSPPPKVKSAVVRIQRKENMDIPCNEKLFFSVVKTAFNQRRKTLSNSLKSILLSLKPKNELFNKRPEQLSVNDFFTLTNEVEKILKTNT